MLASSPINRPLTLPGTQNMRQRRAIQAYVEHGGITEPLARWELERSARAANLAPPVDPAPAEQAHEDEMPWSRLLLGVAAVMILWAFIGWALAPYVLVAYAWLFGVLA